MRSVMIARKRLALMAFSALFLAPDAASATQLLDGNVLLTYSQVGGNPFFNRYVSAGNLSADLAYDFHFGFVDTFGRPVGPSYNFDLSAAPIGPRGTFTFPDPIDAPSEIGTTPITWWTGPAPNHKIITSSVPEPGTWALLLVGFGLIGFVARRRISGSPTQSVQT